MARVLIAWELGEAFGHLARCLRLAEWLRKRGHTVALALKYVRLPGGAGAACGFTVLAPPLTPKAGLAHPLVNYADMLRASSFASRRTWRHVSPPGRAFSPWRARTCWWPTTRPPRCSPPEGPAFPIWRWATALPFRRPPRPGRRSGPGRRCRKRH